MLYLSARGRGIREETAKNHLRLNNVYLTEQRLKVEEKQGNTDKQRLKAKKVGKKKSITCFNQTFKKNVSLKGT